jgi:ribosomal protein S18 acetylase RimI-like enzyme
MPPADPALADRLLEFEVEMERDVSEVVEPHEWGCAYLSPGLDRVWDASFVSVEREGLDAAEIAAIAEEVFGAAGMAHRTLLIRSAGQAESIAGDLEAQGYERERGVHMVWSGEPERPAEAEVEELRHDDVAGLRRTLIRGDLSRVGKELGAEVVEQLLEWDRRLGAVAGDRWFAARGPDGELASCCRLLARDGFGQIEDVGTLRAAREQGLGRSVTLSAAAASRADGNGVTYLGALADDWPRLMYERLGFEPVGINWVFRRKPPVDPEIQEGRDGS